MKGSIFGRHSGSFADKTVPTHR